MQSHEALATWAMLPPPGGIPCESLCRRSCWRSLPPLLPFAGGLMIQVWPERIALLPRSQWTNASIRGLVAASTKTSSSSISSQECLPAASCGMLAVR